MPKLKGKTHKSLTLFSFHIPAALIVMLALVFGTYFTISDTMLKVSDDSLVLGDDDHDEDDEDDDHDEDDEDDRKGRGKDSDDDGDDDHDEDEDDEDDDRGEKDKNKFKTRETVVNADGTTSEIKREIDGDEIKYEVKTFDQFGNKIEESKYESDEDDEKFRLKRYSIFGGKLLDLSFDSEDGEEIDLKVKDENGFVSRLRYDAEGQELRITGEGEGEEEQVRVRIKEKAFELERNGYGVLFNFPITVDDETGQIFVTTGKGVVELKEMPDSIIEKAALAAEFEEIEDVVLEEDDDGDLVYSVEGVDTERLLGLFEVSIRENLIFDAQTGEFLGINQDFLNTLLGFFSF